MSTTVYDYMQDPTQYFVTLCIPKKLFSLSIDEQLDRTQCHAVSLMERMGEIETIVYELTKKLNVHYHIILKSNLDEQILFDTIKATIKSHYKGILEIPQRDAIAFAYDVPHLKNNYLTKQKRHINDFQLF